MSEPFVRGLLPHQSLLRWATERPDSIFLTQPTGAGQVVDITWKNAADEAGRMAAWLHAQGWPAGSRIAIIGKNSAHWILADLAIWLAGHISVPVYSTFHAEALRYIFSHSDCKACFVGKMDSAAELMLAARPEMPLITLPLAPVDLPAQHPQFQWARWTDLIAGAKPLNPLPSTRDEQVSTIIYTSGTTGVPKGVVQTFAAMDWALQSAGSRFVMGPGERYISYLPLAHVAERMLIEQGALRHGGRIFFAESLDTFLQDLQRARPTIFFSVPRLWVKFQQGVHSKLPAPKLQKILSIPWVGRWLARKVLRGLGLDQCRIAAGGAAPMPASVLQWYRQLGLNLIEVYGMTENCGVSHSTLSGSGETGTVGLPYQGVHCRIAPDTGEIQMQSGALMQGYYLEPEQTAAALTPDGWLCTGDKGTLDANGQLRITGRVKDIFKTSKGKYVAPAPIEEKLVLHPDIEACAVTGANFDQPFALVMLSADAVLRSREPDGKEALTASLNAHLDSVNQYLPMHEKLAMLCAITTPWTPESGFVTPTLKVRRSHIESAYGPHFETWLGAQSNVVWV